MARNHSNVSCEVTLARRLYTEELVHGPKWSHLEPYGPTQQKWLRIARQLLGREPMPAQGSTMQDWRSLNPNPTHGCGHMQGRGAA